TLRTLEEALADWRHSAGTWVVNHLNAEQDGLGGTVAGDLDWSAVAAEMSRRRGEVSSVSPANIDREDTHGGDDCDVEANVGAEASQETGALRQWCGQVWQSVRDAAQNVSRQLEQWSDEATAAQDRAIAVPSESEPPRVDEAAKPRGEQ